MKKQRIQFTFSAPEAKSVHIAGSFNDWNMHSDPLNQSREEKASGAWSTFFYLKPGVYEYRFVVDGLWNNDTGSMKGWSNEFGSFNCVVLV
jgi:1,4-alpha-glucan branching enzyme